MKSLSLSEVFGPTFQGEGPSAGRRAAFIRLGLCNLDCSWCDTPFTWDWSGKNGPKQDRSLLKTTNPEELIDLVTGLDVPLVVITGGEPMLQQAGLVPVIESLTGSGMSVEVETNGTRRITEPALRSLVTWNVSPKLSGSGVTPERAIVPEILVEFVAEGARLKFVVSELAEIEEVASLCATIGVSDEQVWIMPEGRTARRVEEGLRRLAEPVLERRWNLGTRLHVTLWDDERGR